MIIPSLKEIYELKNEYSLIPVCKDVLCDTQTPVSLFKKIKATNKEYFMLESVEGGEKWARYSFIGKNPLLTIVCDNNFTTINHRDGTKEKVDGDYHEVIQTYLDKYKSPIIKGLPTFTGGAVGYFSYDAVRKIEYLPNVPNDTLKVPDGYFMLVDEIIAFDHLKQKVMIIVNISADGDVDMNYENALKKIEQIQIELESNIDSEEAKVSSNVSNNEMKNSYPTSNCTKEQYCDAVRKAKKYIVDGDIFQVVLSQRFSFETEVDPLDVYRILRVSNPSPYMYYLNFENFSIVGTSPEMLVKVDNGIVETCPIAGTRKRGKNEAEDENLIEDLLNDDKEKSEHVMLVDLGRNDIGKISEFGTVEVAEYMKVIKYSHVMHITSNVKGVIKKDVKPIEAIKAVLPAGTLSGAPKVRAMEIIDELENVKRGPYGGSIGYFSFNGSLDSCITIRTIVFKDNVAHFQAGAGIVADSDPESEYLESINKAKVLFKALKEAGEMK